MMDAKHTPGPWQAVSNLRDHAGRPSKTPFWHIADHTGVVLSLKTSIKANANLMAAAPDLLEAARRALDLIELRINQELGGSTSDRREGQAMEALSAAIAKATDGAA